MAMLNNQRVYYIHRYGEVYTMNQNSAAAVSYHLTLLILAIYGNVIDVIIWRLFMAVDPHCSSWKLPKSVDTSTYIYIFIYIYIYT